MTYDEYLNEIGGWLKDPSLSRTKDLVGGAGIDNYINNARREVARLLYSLDGHDTFTTTADQETYSLPDNLWIIEEVVYDWPNRRPLTQLYTANDYYQYYTETSGTPQYYWLRRDDIQVGSNAGTKKLFLVPTPDTSSVTCRRDYWMLPADIDSSNQTCDLPTDHDHVAALYAATLLASRAGDDRRAEKLDRLVSDMMHARRVDRNARAGKARSIRPWYTARKGRLYRR